MYKPVYMHETKDMKINMEEELDGRYKAIRVHFTSHTCTCTRVHNKKSGEEL